MDMTYAGLVVDVDKVNEIKCMKISDLRSNYFIGVESTNGFSFNEV
jgi:hypothetical protein